jgi:hypothetical protein
MKVIHSFWSKAYLEGRWGEESKIVYDIYNFALSSHLANKHFNSTDLITDKAGALLLEPLPYKNIHTDLEDISHIDPRFWTAGKVHSMRIQKEPFIHIDGDVFFMNKKCKKRLSGKWDVVVQMREIGDHFSNTYPDVFKNLRKIHPEIDHLNVFNFVYNNGIVGFQDMSLKDEYAYEYFDLLYLLEMNGVKFPPEADPNIVVEQSLLTTLSQFKNAYVKELIPVDEMKKYDLFGAAERIGFVHLWGNSKYQNEYFNKVKARLKAADAKLYKEVKNKIKKI